MGKASRRKREAREVVARQDRPRWAGADGFEYAWRLSEFYLATGAVVLAADDDYGRAKGALAITQHQIEILNRQLGTLEKAYAVQHGQAYKREEERTTETVLPGNYANPRRRVYDSEGNEVVRVWCPPFVKGPDDKPLILKARRVGDSSD